MERKLLTTEDFKNSAKGGTRPDAVVYRLATSEAEVVADAARTLRFVFSDDTIDRMGDRIMQDGWETEEFTRNPVALWAHSSWEPPVGKASNLAVKKGELLGDIEFASADIYEFADT